MIKYANMEDILSEQAHLDLLKGLTSGLDVAVTITTTEENGEREILFVNDAFTRLTGYTRSEVVGQSPSMLQGPATDRGVLRTLNNRLAADRPFHGRAVNYRKNGEPFVMDWQIVTFHDEVGRKRFYMAVQREAADD